jgi:hypothetical protein
MRLPRADRPRHAISLAAAVATLLLVVMSTMPALSYYPEREATEARDVARTARVHPDAIGPRAGKGVNRVPADAETLWIFDADFEDLLGDNAGWMVSDKSGTTARINYWHKDTIRIRNFEHLGDSTWWCGTYNDCWRQPRGYGNNWSCSLVREFPEVAANSEPGDTLVLEYDQRYAMEKDYDYGFTEISTDGGVTWSEIEVVTDPGFGGPGRSQDWDSISEWGPGHVVLDVSDYAGELLTLRFRVHSDVAYSSEDQYNNPPQNSCLDGAWQLDNISWSVNDSVFWLDDCESPGNNGWVHEDLPATGQTGVVFWRGLYGVDFDTYPAFSCDDDRQGWMYAAIDPVSGRMVDGQYSWLMSPAIDIGGAEALVGQWDMWVDMPEATNDVFRVSLKTSDLEHCVAPASQYVDTWPWPWDGGPHWTNQSQDWTPFAGKDWMGIMWSARNTDPPEPGVEHGRGIFLNRQRVGIPSGTPRITWQYGTTCGTRFRDIFQEELASALLDSALVRVPDENGVATVSLLASGDGGATWQSYSCLEGETSDAWWTASPPADLMVPGTEILYYFEATDELGGTSTYPPSAPDDCLEFSVLPINGSIGDPCVLIVDRHGGLTLDETRAYSHSAGYYYQDALDILGYEYDVYQVPFPGYACSAEDGPDTSGMKYYDTQVWVTSDLTANTITELDQKHLTEWLSQAAQGRERNLVVAGNDIGRDLMDAGGETLGFYTSWLAAEFLDDAVGDVRTDSLATLRDADGGFDFMTFDDRRCLLRGGCPDLAYFDIVQPQPGVPGAELVASYVRSDMAALPAGVAYTDTSYGYQAVTLGFGLESMVDVLLPSGTYMTGAPDRVDLLENIMEYFERAPDGPGTGVDGTPVSARLGHARPNPFHPETSISFTLGAAGPVTARIYDLSGRVVRTLLDESLAAGPHELSWDGTIDGGGIAASGVYFVRVESPGFTASRKLVLLK